MNGRLLALLGAIALFVCLWSTPEPDTPAPRPRPVAQVAERVTPRLPSTRQDIPDSLLPAPQPSVVESASVESLPIEPHWSQDSHWSGERLLEELPSELLPGRYRVVSTHGALGEVTIAGTVFGARPQELIVYPDSQVTWYFIRQDDETLETNAHLAIVTPPDVPKIPAANVLVDRSDLRGLPVEDDEPAVPQLTSKERDLLEAQVRYWLTESAVRINAWVLTEWRELVHTQAIR